MLQEEVDIGYNIFEAKQLGQRKDGNFVTRVINFIMRFSESRGEINQIDRLVTNADNGHEIDEIVLYDGYLEQANCQNKRHRFLDSGLVEFTVSRYVDGGPYDEMDVRSYFPIDGQGKIHRLCSARRFPMTEFIRLDSTDFQGCFILNIQDTVHTRNPKNAIRRQYLTSENLTYMLMEIYADDGMYPTLNTYRDTFSKKDWNLYMDADESLLPAMERHNVRVIQRQLERMKGREKEFTKEEIFEISLAG